MRLSVHKPGALQSATIDAHLRFYFTSLVTLRQQWNQNWVESKNHWKYVYWTSLHNCESWIRENEEQKVCRFKDQTIGKSCKNQLEHRYARNSRNSCSKVSTQIITWLEWNGCIVVVVQYPSYLSVSDRWDLAGLLDKVSAHRLRSPCSSICPGKWLIFSWQKARQVIRWSSHLHDLFQACPFRRIKNQELSQQVLAIGGYVEGDAILSTKDALAKLT